MVPDNKFRNIRGTDRVLVGAGTVIYEPKVLELFGGAGLDFAFLDLEHSGFSAWDSESLERYTRAADQANIDLLVRLPSGAADYHPPLVRKVLDTGVRNVIIPRVETPQEVRRAIEASNFHYDEEIGDRGMGAGRTNLWGGLDGDYVSNEDNSTQVGVMIENTTAVENLDEILAIPDLGFVFIGPADLSHSLGRPGEIGDQTVQETIADIEEAVTSADVPLGSFVYDAQDPRPTIEKGYQLLVSGFDAGAIQETFRDIAEQTSKATSE